MPLSDREQELLDQIEQALYAEDPKFATNVRSARPRSHRRRWLVLCGFGVIAGLAMVLVGVARFVPLGIVGFVVIVASCLYATTLLTSRGAQPGPAADGGAGNPNQRKAGVRNRMEDRLKRRFDEN